MKELENKEMGLPVIPIQVAPQVVYQNRSNYRGNSHRASHRNRGNNQA